ncbi:topoisomerase DNA-binding C4 zinc finger domain-containing protein [Mucilaginibacter jinjuensis]|uniref:topoisomerase DNA-binding C4 zinc finger domain-containing protein n=1 Tax=Mucilaginibacter jinjuensis TaxID=1176721 RepID=UPI003B58776F
MFYVAITRARHKNYLLYDTLNPSKFLTELMQAPTIGNPGFQKCPECQGILVKRKGHHNEFYGCSNYPQCNGTRPLLT